MNAAQSPLLTSAGPAVVCVAWLAFLGMAYLILKDHKSFTSPQKAGRGGRAGAVGPRDIGRIILFNLGGFRLWRTFQLGGPNL